MHPFPVCVPKCSTVANEFRKMWTKRKTEQEQAVFICSKENEDLVKYWRFSKLKSLWLNLWFHSIALASWGKEKKEKQKNNKWNLPRTTGTKEQRAILLHTWPLLHVNCKYVPYLYMTDFHSICFHFNHPSIQPNRKNQPRLQFYTYNIECMWFR